MDGVYETCLEKQKKTLLYLQKKMTKSQSNKNKSQKQNKNDKRKTKKMSKVEEICINFKEPESLLTLFSINLKVSNSCQ